MQHCSHPASCHLAKVTVNYHLVYRLQKDTPQASSLLGEWIGQSKPYPVHLPHGTSPSTKAQAASGPWKDWYSHLAHRDYSEEHQPLTPSLGPTAGRQTTTPDPNHWYETTQQMSTTKPLLPIKELSISPAMWKCKLCDLVSAWGRSSVEGLRMALPKTPTWWLAKRIFLFSELWVFSSLSLSDLHKAFTVNLKCKLFFRPQSQGSLLCLEPVATQFSAVPPIWNSTAEHHLSNMTCYKK